MPCTNDAMRKVLTVEGFVRFVQNWCCHYVSNETNWPRCILYPCAFGVDFCLPWLLVPHFFLLGVDP